MPSKRFRSLSSVRCRFVLLLLGKHAFTRYIISKNPLSPVALVLTKILSRRRSFPLFDFPAALHRPIVATFHPLICDPIPDLETSNAGQTVRIFLLKTTKKGRCRSTHIFCYPLPPFQTARFVCQWAWFSYFRNPCPLYRLLYPNWPLFPSPWTKLSGMSHRTKFASLQKYV